MPISPGRRRSVYQSGNTELRLGEDWRLKALEQRRALWRTTLRKAGVPYFRLYDLRSTYATRLSAGGVADEWVTQMLRQTDAQVFKKYSQMKLQMKREALTKLNRKASELDSTSSDTERCA